MNILFLAAFPLVLWMFQGSAVLIATAVLQLFLLSCGLRLIARGLISEARYDAAIAAHAPKWPLKLMGACLIGVTVFLLAGHHFYTLFVPAMLGLASVGLTIAAFGLDPMKDKGMENREEVACMVLASQIDQHELDLASAVHRIAGLGDADLTRRTEAAQDLLYNTIESAREDTEILQRSQKPIAKFVRIIESEVDRLENSWEGDDYLFARRRFVAKLDVLIESFGSFARKSGALEDKDFLDDEAELLLDRMPQESAA
ncbi:hypothetical protein [Thalassococcus lentus]|uniref:5-bromo-4-chloroindolyl phosphate hydrolysis protein n=1 Tax=Thalassococcus lentus TaxID=1210524 RepID=A0ABT4XWI6_9RHOB|nr:hypothetical protein [Thalassococcus lentus]MDA7426252.1 hypothetical protein [Thalassococcus lentus]